MDAFNPTWTTRIRRAFAHIAGSRPSAVQARYDEILNQTGRTLSLDELLVLFPERVCAALNLACFDIFLRHGSRYVLERPSAPRDWPELAFPASGSTVSRMKRERKPAVFADPSAADAVPEAWQLLATPQEIAALEQLGARVLVPLEGRTGLMGFVALAPKPGKGLTQQELDFLQDLGPQMGRGLETAQLVRTISEQAVRRAHVQRELELAREVQERLLPGRLPQTPGLDVAALYHSAEEVGGDYYDLFPTSSGLLCCAIGDVSGKGVSSAILMATLRATLRALMLGAPSEVREITARLNSQLFQASSQARYATFFLALYDPATATLTYVNAGHNSPLLLRAGGPVQRLTTGGSVLGLLPGLAFEQETLTLASGDRLIAYTDGISEAVNQQGVEWEESGLLHALAAQSASSAEQTVAHVRQTLEAFTAGAAQADDMTLLILHRQ